MSKDLREILGEECGLAAAINIPNASDIVMSMLGVQQHRGEAGAGIVSSNHRNLYLQKGKGRVDVVFPEDFDLKKLPGKVAMGHNRYATRGSVDEKCNVQPLLFKETKYGQFAIGHNGQLIDVNGVKDDMLKNGVIFQSTTDSEVLGHLIAQSKKKTIEDAIASEITKIPTAYSALIMTKTKLIAFRDAYGVRPLSIAKLGKGYLVASETSAFRLFDEAEHIRDVRPGELVVFDKKSVRNGEGFKSIQFAEQEEYWCIFEGIYFSSPRSECNKFMHEDFRQLCGMKVFEENSEYFREIDPDCVIPILDSGKQGAIGFGKASSIPYKEYFMRRHNAPKSKGRSYTAANQAERDFTAHMKLDLRREKVKDRIVVTVDDSIVRGTTSRRNNDRLRKAGAKMIINVVLSPPLISTCRMGMDHQTLNELVAYRCGGDYDKIAEEVGADKVLYISLDGLNDVVNETYDKGICSGCFGGKYPLQMNGK